MKNTWLELAQQIYKGQYVKPGTTVMEISLYFSITTNFELFEIFLIPCCLLFGGIWAFWAYSPGRVTDPPLHPSLCVTISLCQAVRISTTIRLAPDILSGFQDLHYCQTGSRHTVWGCRDHHYHHQTGSWHSQTVLSVSTIIMILAPGIQKKNLWNSLGRLQLNLTTQSEAPETCFG